MTRVEISRAKWLRGTGDGRLLNSEGKMCCLGFACLAFGATEKEIGLYRMPRHVSAQIPDWMRQRYAGQTPCDVELAANINDSEQIDDAERERHITEIFARNGLEAVFVP